ncbi:hypothetical protein CMUC_0286 [Campylobacter mucosalis CCUG 21559]|uniref:Uncharacterized protein n=1 Tax=Campylobacter mucosalis CCUG 21559 TaxID=1032067 RepID=A0A6G5QEJ3_9BACT|nr:hypothetical protein CMUC_0286 [Campylobacter mucosalis CCUG 21559]
MNNEISRGKELSAKERIKRFDKMFIKISKKLRKLNESDQTKMIGLIISRFNYDERLKRRKFILDHEFGRK